MTNEWIMLLLGLVVGLGVFAIGVRFFPQLSKQKQGYPMEEQIEQALLPHVFNAINAAYKVSEKAVDDIEVRIRGADKATIAKEVYKLLPNEVGGHDIAKIKSMIGEDRFANLIQTSYQQFDQFFDQHRSHFDQMYEEWRRENEPL